MKTPRSTPIGPKVANSGSMGSQIVVGQHHRAGMKVVVDQRLRDRKIIVAEAPGRGANPAVRPEILDERVEMRCRPVAPFARHERILIDDLEHDSVLDMIGLQLGDPLVLELLFLVEIQSEEGRGRFQFHQTAGHARVNFAGDNSASQDLVPE